MRRRLRARGSDCEGCARKGWRCNWAGRPAHWPRSASAGLRSCSGSRRSSTCRHPRRPGHSDRFAEIAAAFAILTGTCGKIGRDIALLMQTEVAEAFEPGQPGEHKPPGAIAAQRERAPAVAATAICAATLAPNLLATIVAAQVQEHEAAVGSWQAQWHALRTLSLVASGALAAVADIAQGLEVDAERMRSNVERTQGLIMAEAVWMALCAKLTREAARKIVEEASHKAVAEQRHLSAVLAEDPRVTAHMSSGELARLSQLAAENGVSTGKKLKNASPVKGGAQKSRRSEDQVGFQLA
jgi:3-carboxy-cis,cis-muconate cycloisomerase